MGAVPSEAAREISSAAEVRDTLSRLMPHLTPFWTRPLHEYAHAIHDVARFHSEHPDRHQAMIRLQNCVVRAAGRFGINEEDARTAGQQLAVAPVIQSGPHCLLIIEPDAFYTHLFSLLGLSAHARQWYISYHSSTVTFAERAKKGPGWLSLEGEPLNVFGLPRRRMDSYSICGFNGPLRFALSDATGAVAPNETAARLMTMLPTIEFRSAAEAIKTANQTLWRRWFPSSAQLLQLDDFDVADLVAEHLDDAESWVATCLIGDGRFADSILTALDRINVGPWAGWVRRSTDLFWGLANGRIVPLRLHGNVLRAREPSMFEVTFRPDTIAAALRRREIVPSLLTAFVVMSILPGVRVLGGCRQTVYYPLMRHLVATALEQLGQWDLLEALAGDVRPGMWGHRVLKPDGGYPFREIERSGGVPDILQTYTEQPLAQACGSLASFTSDPIWAELSAHIEAGTISAGSNEWRWARS